MLVTARPFAYIGQVFLEIQLSKDNSDAPSMYQSTLSDELVQNPLDNLELFPVRTPEEELLAVEWGELDSLFAAMSGLRQVTVDVGVSEKLSKDEFDKATDTIRERMVRMHEEEKFSIKGTQFRETKAQNDSG